MKIVTIDIDTDGTTSVDLAGFAGKGCDKVAEDFRGSDTLKSSTHKRERANEEPQSQKERIRQ